MTENLNLPPFWEVEFDEHKNVVAATRAALYPAFQQLLNAAVTAVQNGNKVMFFGNGGSAADAQHLATELSVRYKNDRAPIPGIALTTDTSTLTAAGNDYGFAYIFSRQIEAIGQKGDIAIAISTSGNSENILQAIKACKEKDITVVGFTGKTGGAMAAQCDILFNVPSTTTARIQEMHITLGQMFCGAIEIELGLIAAPEGLGKSTAQAA